MAVLTTAQTYPNTDEGKIAASLELGSMFLKEIGRISNGVLDFKTEDGTFNMWNAVFTRRVTISAKGNSNIFLYSGSTSYAFIMGGNLTTEGGYSSLSINVAGYGLATGDFVFGKRCIAIRDSVHEVNSIGIAVGEKGTPIMFFRQSSSTATARIHDMRKTHSVGTNSIEGASLVTPNSGYCMLCNVVDLEGDIIEDVYSYKSNPTVDYCRNVIFGGKEYTTITVGFCI